MSTNKAQAVTARLTDTSKYTGSHKERFDEKGNGKGIHGRKDVVEFTGSTVSANRDPVSKASRESLNGSERKPVVSQPLGKEKFGVQAEKPKSILLFRNGDKNFGGHKVLLKTFRNIDQLLANATDNVKLTTGPCKKIYKSDLKTIVKSLDEFEDGECYLCCSGEQPNKERLSPKFIQK
jgi:hypothetical protein